MTKKDLVKIIRAVVKSEVNKVVQAEINEAMTILEQKKSQSMTLSEAVADTKNGSLSNDEPWPSMGDFKSNMRSQFASMNGQTITPQTDIGGRPVDQSKLDPTIAKALNRDYSELVKRFK
tara:strand:+ start:1780 stop:2139 length:360 start_codon:yes stop_codon:yes gene_type:complete